MILLNIRKGALGFTARIVPKRFGLVYDYSTA